jgi:hypothetical protein
MTAETADKSADFASVGSEATSVTGASTPADVWHIGDLIAISGAMTPEIAIKADWASFLCPGFPYRNLDKAG